MNTMEESNLFLNGRELTISDFLSACDDPQQNENMSHKHKHKSNKYRKQVEYGEKKYIKPWRTGTKSQQIPTKGNNKGKR